MNTSPFVIENQNLSQTWVHAVRKIRHSGHKELTPLIVTITDFSEDKVVRDALDAALNADKKGSVQTVSNTIFPYELSKMHPQNRQSFFDEYLEILPRIKAIDKSANGKGTYFQRLIAFDGKNPKPINQLDELIKSLQNPNMKRRSKFQATTFDPSTDVSEGPYQKFPCLQHVTAYKTETGGLILNSFYAMQYLYERAYGNWLGLINLGKFIATEVGIPFERFTCFIGIEKLEINKGKADKILSKIP